MAVREYVKACQEVFKSGLVKEGIIKEHIEQQIVIDKLLPDTASFFFVVEPAKGLYHFVGKQQEKVTGYSNSEMISRGIEFFFENLHPDETSLLIEKVYPEISKSLEELSRETDIKTTFTQFNYRFRIKSGNYVNLLEHLYVLETDKEGRPALFLGNIVTLGNKKVLPIRLTMKTMNDCNILETVFSKNYDSKHSTLSDITGRELEILRNLALGKTSQQISNELFISRHTVDTHRRSLLKKLNCSSAVELTRVAFQNGLL